MKNLMLYVGLLLISFSPVLGQYEKVDGKVCDAQGNPLASVEILARNSGKSVFTDETGTFVMQLIPGDSLFFIKKEGFPVKKITLYELRHNKIIRMIRKADIRKKMIDYQSTEHSVSLPKGKETFFHTMPRKSYLNGGRNSGFLLYNTESYSAVNENGYKNVLVQPLSTFSIDVDNASYSNVRRFLNLGQIPPSGAVRIEEMINYFSYNYSEPENSHPFSLTTELSLCPWNENHQLLHIGLKGKEMEKQQIPPSNLVFLIDVSGSMNHPNKLPLLKSSFELLVKTLRKQDKVSIVVYAGAAGLVLEPTSGTDKDKILSALKSLNAGGATAGGEGLQLAYRTALENFAEGGNNRIILATDGDFNVGPSSNAAMEELIVKNRDKGVYITVLGFGMGNYKDDKMEIIANKGNGNYSYIDNIHEAKKVLMTEFAGTIYTLARDVKLQLEFNPLKVKAYRLIGYENRILNDEDFNNDKKDAGELGAGHTVTALYEIIPAGSDESVPETDELKYQKILLTDTNNLQMKKDLLTLKIRYKLPGDSESIKFEKSVPALNLPQDQTSDNFKFSAAVACFGMILKDSEYKGNFALSDVIGLAESSTGIDREGYRQEFVRLVQMASELKK